MGRDWAGGNWSTNVWTSRVPLPQDDVALSSAFAAVPTVTADMPRLGRSISWPASSNSVVWALTSTGNTVYGSITLKSNVTISHNQALVLRGRSSYTLTSAGKSYAGNTTLDAPGGTYTLLDNYVNTAAFTLTNGTFDLGGFNASCTVFASTGTNTRALLLGAGTWSLTGTGTANVWNVTASLALTPGTATINITATDSGVTKTFVGGGLTYGTLRHTATGSAALTITGNNTFANLDLECTTARTITFPAGGSQTVTGTFTALGAAGQLLSLRSSSTGTKWYINAATTSAQYCDVKDSTASGTGTPIDNSTGGVDSGNNIGWLFSACGSAGYSSTLLTLGVG